MDFLVAGLDSKCHTSGERVFLILEDEVPASACKPGKYLPEIGVNCTESGGECFVLHLFKFLYPFDKGSPFTGQGVFSLGSFSDLPLYLFVLFYREHVYRPNLPQCPISLCYLPLNLRERKVCICIPHLLPEHIHFTAKGPGSFLNCT